jgi:polyhydroxyalkanoate synthesis regulator phasin
MPLDPDLLPSVPKTETEWMMQFGEGPSNFDVSHIGAVQRAVEELDDKLRECIEAKFYERASYSKIAARLNISKPHAWRLTQRAIAELQRKLIGNSEINERYVMFEYWEDASRSMLEMIEDTTTARRANMASLDACATFISNKVRNLEEIPIDVLIVVGQTAISHLKKCKAWFINDMHELLVSKQHDYGHKNILMFGSTGIGIRICDKIARLQTLLNNESDPHNESLLDSWYDLVGYATLAKMLDNNVFTLELKGVNND